MMRNDGLWTFFQIQHLQTDGAWMQSSFDYFGTPPFNDGDVDRHLKFSASGDCWQQTGQHGTYDQEYAEMCLRAMQKKHTETTFRLVLQVVSQKTLALPLDLGAE